MRRFKLTPETLIILENDLYRRAPETQIDKFLESAEHVIVLDHLANQTTDKAELLLPAGTFAESDGTLVSSEGRAQRFFPVFAHNSEVRESWRWLGDPAWSTLDDPLAALAKALPRLAPVVQAAPSSKFRMAGAKIPREPHRYSGLTSITANISVVEPKPPDDPGFGSRLFHGGQSRPAAERATALFLVSRLELDSGSEQVSDRDWRCAQRRRSRSSFVRALAERSLFHRPFRPLLRAVKRNGW